MFGCYNLFHYLCIVHTHASGRNGWNSDILESVIDALFLAIWNFHNTDKPVKSNSGDECYGCSIYSRSVPRANYALTHTFRGALYTDRRGYSDSVRSLVGLWKASDSGTGRWGYPAFCMPLSIAKNPLTHGCQSEQILTDASKHGSKEKGRCGQAFRKMGWRQRKSPSEVGSITANWFRWSWKCNLHRTLRWWWCDVIPHVAAP